MIVVSMILILLWDKEDAFPILENVLFTHKRIIENKRKNMEFHNLFQLEYHKTEMIILIASKLKSGQLKCSRAKVCV